VVTGEHPVVRQPVGIGELRRKIGPGGVSGRDGVDLLRVDVVTLLIDQNRCPSGEFGRHRGLQRLVGRRFPGHCRVAVDVDDVGLCPHRRYRNSQRYRGAQP
jgi:hypothetical protein